MADAADAVVGSLARWCRLAADGIDGSNNSQHAEQDGSG
jgi:hypothetical protein